jgi:hypothetical protein
VFGFQFNRNIKGNNEGIGLAEKIRSISRAQRRRSYWISIVFLTGCAVLSGLIFGPALKSKGSVFSRPTHPEPVYQLLAIKEVRVNKLKGLTVLAQTAIQPEVDSLQVVLDWILYSMLDKYNRRQKDRIRVVWVYVYNDSVENIAQWRAMAIWVDPKLPQASWPEAARIGGDAIRKGAVEYDFTNPLKGMSKKEQIIRI